VEFPNGRLKFMDCLLLKTGPWNRFQAVLNNHGSHSSATEGDTAVFLSFLSVFLLYHLSKCRPLLIYLTLATSNKSSWLSDKWRNNSLLSLSDTNVERPCVISSVLVFVYDLDKLIVTWNGSLSRSITILHKKSLSS